MGVLVVILMAMLALAGGAWWVWSLALCLGYLEYARRDGWGLR